MPTNAYLFTAITTMSQVLPAQGRYGMAGESFQVWDGCSSLSLLAASVEEAQKCFEDWLTAKPDGQHPRTVQIHKIAAAQYVDQLFTETGDVPLDWPQLQAQAQARLQAAAADDFEQGYWVDVDQVVRPAPLSPDITALQQSQPEDIRTGLNWSADKQFFFLVTIFSAPPPPLDWDETRKVSEPVESADEAISADDPEDLQRLLTQYPRGMDKDAAALIQARNSVVAAWLWRRYAADTQLAANRIQLDPWDGVWSCEGGGEPEAK